MIYAIVAITKHGVELCSTIYMHCLHHSDLYYMSKFEKGDEDAKEHSAVFGKRTDASTFSFSTI